MLYVTAQKTNPKNYLPIIFTEHYSFPIITHFLKKKKSLVCQSLKNSERNFMGARNKAHKIPHRHCFLPQNRGSFNEMYLPKSLGQREAVEQYHKICSCVAVLNRLRCFFRPQEAKTHSQSRTYLHRNWPKQHSS